VHRRWSSTGGHAIMCAMNSRLLHEAARFTTRVLAAALLCLHASLSTAGTWSDIWWNPAESGWGVNIAQHSGAMFMTFFVYAADRSAHWYGGTAYAGNVGASGFPRYDGDLYETQGPGIAGPFNPSSVVFRQVGSITFVPSALGSATLSYTVDGVNVVKTIERQTFRQIRFSGSYVGGYSVKRSACAGVSVGSFGTVTMDISATAATDGISGAVGTTINLDGTVPCVLSGSYRQVGSLVTVANPAACSTGAVQMNYTDITPADDGLAANVQVLGPAGCVVSLAVSAVRK
jgi:hypothetical protein